MEQREIIRVQNADCRIFKGYGFMELLVMFMDRDPRINLEPEERRRIMRYAGIFNKEETPKIISDLNRRLECSISNQLNLEDMYQTFNFYVPIENKIVEIRLDALSLHDILDSGPAEIEKAKQQIINGVYEVRGICDICAREIGVDSMFLRNNTDYDGKITPEEIIEIARQK